MNIRKNTWHYKLLASKKWKLSPFNDVFDYIIAVISMILNFIAFVCSIIFLILVGISYVYPNFPKVIPALLILVIITLFSSRIWLNLIFAIVSPFTKKSWREELKFLDS